MDEPSTRRWDLPVLLCCRAVFIVMPPLRAVGQGLWLMPLKPWVHLNGATYPGCVEWEAKVQGYVAKYPRDTRGSMVAEYGWEQQSLDRKSTRLNSSQ